MVDTLKIPMNEVKSVAYKNKNGETKDVKVLKLNDKIIWSKTTNYRLENLKVSNEIETTEVLNDFAFNGGDRIVVVGSNRSIYNSWDFGNEWFLQSSKVTNEDLNVITYATYNNLNGSFITGGKNILMNTESPSSHIWNVVNNCYSFGNISFIGRYNQTDKCLISSDLKLGNMPITGGKNTLSISDQNTINKIVSMFNSYILLDDGWICKMSNINSKISDTLKIINFNDAKSFIYLFNNPYSIAVLCKDNIVRVTNDEFATYKEYKIESDEEIKQITTTNTGIMVGLCEHGVYAIDGFKIQNKLDFPDSELGYSKMKFYGKNLVVTREDMKKFYRAIIVKDN